MTSIYSPSTPEIAHRRRELATNQQTAFDAFSKAVFADGALSVKTKQIIAVAVAHVTQCPTALMATRKRHYGRERRLRNSPKQSG
jgi:alkylhydroperoxidase/carboxymuconolactone decarboxylase family protein YurZ